MESSTEGGSVLLEGALSGAIIRAFYRVYDNLGYGFLESVYCAALAQELTQDGIEFVREAAVDVFYKGTRAGHFRADFLVEGRVIVEAKASELLTEAHRKQLLNWLAASDIDVGLLLHFGPKARFARVVHTTKRRVRV
jgi:GxxExxY protein